MTKRKREKEELMKDTAKKVAKDELSILKKYLGKDAVDDWETAWAMQDEPSDDEPHVVDVEPAKKKKKKSLRKRGYE